MEYSVQGRRQSAPRPTSAAEHRSRRLPYASRPATRPGVHESAGTMPNRRPETRETVTAKSKLAAPPTTLCQVLRRLATGYSFCLNSFACSRTTMTVSSLAAAIAWGGLKKKASSGQRRKPSSRSASRTSGRTIPLRTTGTPFSSTRESGTRSLPRLQVRPCGSCCGRA